MVPLPVPQRPASAVPRPSIQMPRLIACLGGAGAPAGTGRRGWNEATQIKGQTKRGSEGAVGHTERNGEEGKVEGAWNEGKRESRGIRGG